MTKPTDIGTISQDELRKLLDYACDTGIFKARITRADLVQGQIAGYLHRDSGYWLITINWRKYKAHRLAWLYVYGEWPDEELDHVNRNKSDNAINNLRQCTSAQNNMNRDKRADNTSGFKGVYFDIRTRKWRAYITVEKKRMYFGRYINIDDAVRARQEAELKWFGVFSNA